MSQNEPFTANIDIPGCNIEHKPTESSAGRTLIYFSKDISYKIRDDLQMYSLKESESIFIEIMAPNKFYNDFLEPLLNKIKKEDKGSFLLGDYNFHLIKYT